MLGIGIEVWLQEMGSKFGYRDRDRSLVTEIEIEVVLQELRSKLVTGNACRGRYAVKDEKFFGLIWPSPPRFFYDSE